MKKRKDFLNYFGVGPLHFSRQVKYCYLQVLKCILNALIGQLMQKIQTKYNSFSNVYSTQKSTLFVWKSVVCVCVCVWLCVCVCVCVCVYVCVCVCVC